MVEDTGPTEKEKPNDALAEQKEEQGEPQSLSNGETNGLEELKERIQQLTEEAEQLRDKWLRAVAELDNFRKRSAREREELLRQVQGDVIKEFLPILDNLQRALAHSNNQDGQPGLLEGIKMIERQFSNTLERLGVTPIEALHQAFDPGRHEAMIQVETEEFEPNVVVEELERGYLWHDRLLRPAKVAVSKRKETS